MCKPTFFPEQRALLTTCKAGKRWGRSSCQNVLHSKNPTRGEEGRRTNSLASNLSPSLTALPTPPPPTRPRGSLSRKSPLKSSPSGDSLCHSARSPAALAFGRGRHLPAPRPPSLPPPLKLREPSPQDENHAQRSSVTSTPPPTDRRGLPSRYGGRARDPGQPDFRFLGRRGGSEEKCNLCRRRQSLTSPLTVISLRLLLLPLPPSIAIRPDVGRGSGRGGR